MTPLPLLLCAAVVDWVADPRVLAFVDRRWRRLVDAVTVTVSRAEDAAALPSGTRIVHHYIVRAAGDNSSGSGAPPLPPGILVTHLYVRFDAAATAAHTRGAAAATAMESMIATVRDVIGRGGGPPAIHLDLAHCLDEDAAVALSDALSDALDRSGGDNLRWLGVRLPRRRCGLYIPRIPHAPRLRHLHVRLVGPADTNADADAAAALAMLLLGAPHCRYLRLSLNDADDWRPGPAATAALALAVFRIPGCRLIISQTCRPESFADQ